jgi:hypothetical protein
MPSKKYLSVSEEEKMEVIAFNQLFKYKKYVCIIHFFPRVLSFVVTLVQGM